MRCRQEINFTRRVINEGAKQGSWVILILKAHCGTLWVKKDALETDKIKGKGKIFFCFVVFLVRTLS